MKWQGWAVLVLALALVGWLGYREIQRSRHEAALAHLSENQQKRIDSLVARLAIAQPMADSLPAITAMAKQYHAKLLAGVTITVPGKTVHDTVWGEVPATPDAIRSVATYDSSAALIADITATAPPYPAPIQVTRRLVVPPWTAEVGFLQVGDSTLAVVHHGADSIRVGVPFFRQTRRAHDVVGVRLQGLVGTELRGDPLAAARVQAFLNPTQAWGLFLESEARVSPAVRQVTVAGGVQRTF